jgi:hypothetical protein
MFDGFPAVNVREITSLTLQSSFQAFADIAQVGI